MWPHHFRAGGSLRNYNFFFVNDRPEGPPQRTANRQPPPTANCQPPPTTSGDQPPTANHFQPPSSTNPQPQTAANHHQPPPTASRQLPTANRHQPWLNTWCARGLFWENCVTEHCFFFPLRTALLSGDGEWVVYACSCATGWEFCTKVCSGIKELVAIFLCTKFRPSKCRMFLIHPPPPPQHLHAPGQQHRQQPRLWDSRPPE